jgi:hypothetical protein
MTTTAKPLINLVWGKRYTTAYFKLAEGLDPEGATIRRRARGYSDYHIVEALVDSGLMCVRHEGPRGGARYFTTPLGALEMDKSRKLVAPFPGVQVTD